mgnify:CR=1 FL=1
MSVKIKTAHEIELMREAGRILALVHENLAKEIRPGMSTLEIDRLGEEMIRGYGCIPSFKNYNGYPASVCVSINEEVNRMSEEEHQTEELLNNTVIEISTIKEKVNEESITSFSNKINNLEEENKKLKEELEKIKKVVSITKPQVQEQKVTNNVGENKNVYIKPEEKPRVVEINDAQTIQKIHNVYDVRIVERIDPRSVAGVLASFVSSATARFEYANARHSATALSNQSFIGSAIITVWSPCFCRSAKSAATD